jgi:prepilin-type N-terminal cleavage/methylation domain-containing protein
MAGSVARGNDRGDTLLEVMVAVAILGIAAVVIVAGMTLSAKVSDYHRKEANAASVLRNYAESITYTSCTPGSSVSPYALGQKAGFNPPVVTVKYWTGTSFSTTTCPASGDPGVQQVQLAVATPDGRASEALTVIVRQP